MANSLFHEIPAAGVVFSRIVLSPESGKQCKKGTATSDSEVISYLLQTYATVHVSAEVDTGIRRFLKPSTMTSKLYAESLYTQALCCDLFYDDKILEGIFMDGLLGSI